MPNRTTDLERFMVKVDRNGPVPTRRPDLGPCWIWMASLGSAGYGQFKADGTPQGAHRWLFQHRNGPVAPGLEVDHLCFVRECVNPAHLEAVTKAENIARGDSQPAQNARATACIHGHELTGRNVYFRKDRPGRRQCRECSRIAKRKPQSGGRVSRSAA